jgi:hypothetical protein
MPALSLEALKPRPLRPVPINNELPVRMFPCESREAFEKEVVALLMAQPPKPNEKMGAPHNRSAVQFEQDRIRYHMDRDVESSFGPGRNPFSLQDEAISKLRDQNQAAGGTLASVMNATITSGQSSLSKALSRKIRAKLFDSLPASPCETSAASDRTVLFNMISQNKFNSLDALDPCPGSPTKHLIHGSLIALSKPAYGIICGQRRVLRAQGPVPRMGRA